MAMKVDPKIIVTAAGIVLIVASGIIGGVTAVVGITPAAVATVGAVVTGSGIVLFLLHSDICQNLKK